jgi:predicted N-acetyltransferase YhbS
MKYEIRPVKPEEVRAALDMAYKVFMEFEAPVYCEEGIKTFYNDCTANDAFADNYISGRHLMLGAFDGEKIVGMIASKGDSHISMVFVDKNYQRQGVATSIMCEMVVALKLGGAEKITVNSSPYGVPFYHNFGFVDTDKEQTVNGLTFTPMVYTPKELWDVYDKNRNKTGKIVERGKPMSQDEYHLVVEIWIKNSKWCRSSV